MKYPEEVITTAKKGKREVRALLDRGEYVRYRYLDPETGEEERKVKIVLRSAGKWEEYFIIPTKFGRYLLIPAESKGPRKIWNGEKAVEL